MSAAAFKIRGHHLGLFAEVAAGSRTPEEIAKIKVAHYTWLALDPGIESGAPEDKDYAEDIIGETAYGAVIVQKRIAAVFDQYVKLQPDNLVTITTTGRDAYCKCCVVGKHCIERGPELAMKVGERTLQVYKYQIADMYGVRNFLKLSEQLIFRGVIDPGAATLYRHSDMEMQPSEHAISIFAPEANLPAPDHISYQVPLTARAAYVKAVLTHW